MDFELSVKTISPTLATPSLRLNSHLPFNNGPLSFLGRAIFLAKSLSVQSSVSSTSKSPLRTKILIFEEASRPSFTLDPELSCNSTSSEAPSSFIFLKVKTVSGKVPTKTNFKLIDTSEVT
uniref:Uncharacterized protein n=1 Tax=Opuntia streptacantha TaxID=393608 RepID=A0A7C9ESL9_OPUST